MIALFSAYIISASYGSEICYDNIGCFTDEPPFSVDGYRPPKLPDSPIEINPRFFLTNNKVDDLELEWTSPAVLNFRYGSNVIVATHGWIDEYINNEESFLRGARAELKIVCRIPQNLVQCGCSIR